jgi:hypothetical protein
MNLKTQKIIFLQDFDAENFCKDLACFAFIEMFSK